jgi:hypothetical protein
MRSRSTNYYIAKFSKLWSGHINGIMLLNRNSGLSGIHQVLATVIHECGRLNCSTVIPNHSSLIHISQRKPRRGPALNTNLERGCAKKKLKYDIKTIKIKERGIMKLEIWGRLLVV